MIYTTQEEINLVKKNLVLFENRVPEKILNLLLNRQLRIEQHGLFFSLCDKYIYPYLLEALENVKKYDMHKYFPKALSKLFKNYEWFFQRTAVAEIIVASYYFKKFLNDNSFEVEWERKVTNTGKSVDISILNRDNKKFINIEVTGKMKDIGIRDYFNLRYKVKVEIEKKIEKFPEQKYNYIFSILNEGKKESEKLFERHIPDFVDFIAEAREKGIGKYSFTVDGKKLATVEIRKLERLKREYANSYKDVWVGWLKDYKRLRSIIVNKAKDQLPRDEINFVYVPNLSNFDDLDFQEAFWGKELYNVNFKTEDTKFSRKQDGVINIVKENNYSSIYGFLYSKWDYNNKKLLINPFIECEKWTIDAIK